MVLEKIAAAEFVDQVLKEHPKFTKEPIKLPALAADALRANVIYPLKGRMLES